MAFIAPLAAAAVDTIATAGAGIASAGAATAGIGATIAGGATAAGAGLGALTTAGLATVGAGTAIAGGLAAGAAAAGGSTILHELGTTALTTAAGVGLTKLLNPAPKIPNLNQPTPVMPVPNDAAALNRQRQLAAQQAATRLGRQSTILQSPGPGDYQSATF